MAKQKKAIAAARKIRVSLNALQNIREVTGYIAFVNQQPLNAIKVGDAFFTLFERIEQNPFAFKECIELPTKTKMYRQASCFSWLVIYKINDTEVIILGIIHGSRKPFKIRSLKKIK